MQVFEASITYFALVFGLGFLLGAIRVLFIVPRFGVRKAELIETPFMLTGIILAAQFVVKQFLLFSTNLALISVGLLALILVIIAEILFINVLQKSTVRQYIKSRDKVSGSAYLFLLLFFALMPLIMREIST